MKSYHIYGMGNALLDVEYKISDEQLLRMGVDKGHMTLVDLNCQRELLGTLGTSRVRACGGSVANSLIAASHLGATTFYSCRVARDLEGLFYLDDLKVHGVDSRDLALGSEQEEKEATEEVTGRCLLMVTPDGERSMNTYLGASFKYSVDDVSPEALSCSEYLYIEGYLMASPSSREAVLFSRELACSHGVKIAFSFSDVNMVKNFPEEMKEVLEGGVELLFANEEEFLVFTGKTDIYEAMKAVGEFANIVVATRGSLGAFIFQGGRVIEVPGHPAVAVDTNGAGDMFAGTFLFELICGQKDLAQIGDFACRCAAQVVQKWGPRLSRKEIQEVARL